MILDTYRGLLGVDALIVLDQSQIKKGRDKSRPFQY